MKWITLIAITVLVLAGCEDKKYENIWSLENVTPGSHERIAALLTEEQCLGVIQNRTEVNFGAVTSFTASDEEEHGLGLVLICVPARRFVE